MYLSSIHLSIYLSIYLSIFLIFYLYLYLSIILNIIYIYTVTAVEKLRRSCEDTAPSFSATFPVKGKQGKQTSINSYINGENILNPSALRSFIGKWCWQIFEVQRQITYHYAPASWLNATNILGPKCPCRSRRGQKY